MNLPFNHFGRLVLMAALPAALLSSCGNDDDSPPPTPEVDTGKVMLVNAAVSTSAGIKFLANDAQIGQLDYGQNSGYDKVAANSAVTVKANNATTNATLATLATSVAKDANYSIFAYAPTFSTVGLLQLTDDLTAPASGQAKIRLVHLGEGLASPLKLSAQSITGQADVPGISSAFGAANSFGFVSVPAGDFSLIVTSGAASSPVLYVGNGNGGSDPANGGTSTSTTVVNRYESGKIYTILVRGSNNSLGAANQQPRVVVIKNN